MNSSLMPIRSCRRDDLPQVAQLFLKAFPRGWHSSADELAHYFAQVYFDNPWTHDDLPSLVFEQAGAIEGFVGVVPRHMTYQGNDIRVVVPSAFMVSQDDAGRRNPIVAIGLLRRLLDGEQDLTLTDTANELSRSLFTNCGGTIAYPYTFNWLRPLRPFCAGMEMASRVLPRFIPMLANPFARLGDAISASLPVNPFKVRNKPDWLVEDMDTSTHLEAMQSLPEYSLMPSYDLASLQWLIDMAQQSETEGSLARRIVRAPDGRVKGWFIYYQNRRSVGRVLQLVATHQSMQDVFNCLLHEAQEAGLAALWGRTDPLHPDLSMDKRCVFFAKPMVLVHSKRTDIVRSVLAGEMFFSGLEGELWMAVNAWS
jgi:hypothetical protein